MGTDIRSQFSGSLASCHKWNAESGFRIPSFTHEKIKPNKMTSTRNKENYHYHSQFGHWVSITRCQSRIHPDMENKILRQEFPIEFIYRRKEGGEKRKSILFLPIQLYLLSIKKSLIPQHQPPPPSAVSTTRSPQPACGPPARVLDTPSS